MIRRRLCSERGKPQPSIQQVGRKAARLPSLAVAFAFSVCIAAVTEVKVLNGELLNTPSG